MHEGRLYSGAGDTVWRRAGDISHLQNSLFEYIFYTMIRFEYDENKSRSNLAKHGIDFADAQRLWDDPDILEVPAKNLDEARFLIIGCIGRHHWSAVVTYRQNVIRLISVRRSRAEEVSIYESKGL